MSRLRRDLIERRLWIVVVALVAAVAAVPFLLHGHGNASADVVAPPPAAAAGTPAVAAGSGTTQAASDRSGRRTDAPGHTSTNRNPFAAVGAASSTTTSSSTTSSAGVTTTSATTPASTGGSTAGSTPGGVVEPTPTSGASSTETTTVTVTAPTPTTTPGATTAAVTGDGPWTVYAVDARFGTSDHVTSLTNIARLTPLPSVATPKVMFTGVLDHGHQAVFALGEGVEAVGQGWCRPSHSDCAAIALAPGAVEQLSWFAADGSTVTEGLEVGRIASLTVTSPDAAAAAFARHSQAGQCELDLANPVAYDATSGTVSPIAKDACRGVRHAVPFPGPLNGS